MLSLELDWGPQLGSSLLSGATEEPWEVMGMTKNRLTMTTVAPRSCRDSPLQALLS